MEKFKNSNLKLLNLGCGRHYHNDWTNVDFISTGEKVIAHNLLNGIPFAKNSFDVVYHSHVLEHFEEKDGENFIKECYNVLKPKGIIRVAVPDLEQIAQNYLKYLNASIENDKDAEHNYNWTMIELYDQTTRNYSGGKMGEYLKSNMPNPEFVYSRIGKPSNTNYEKLPVHRGSFFRFFNPMTYLRKAKVLLLSSEEKKALKIGKFRMQGENHLYMYDRFSLKRLLEKCGFKHIEIKDAYKSNIPDWNKYKLDVTNTVRKPDSLFMEAVK
ncbi:MAG: methyltransferase domain-containing protein [Saprospiraceae bacterium]|nr:methyltransferase domain-containing protein [Saprospiraceae bacterium]